LVVVAKRLHRRADADYEAAGTAYRHATLNGRHQAESSMKTREAWGQHLREFVNKSLDPVVYAVQWARDPRCLQMGSRHRRVGATAEEAICRLWLGASGRSWR
jgi:hypothetical protein